MPCQYVCYSHSYLLFKTFEWFSFVSTPDHTAPIDAVGTIPHVIFLSMRLLHDSHIPDGPTDFATTPRGSQGPSVASPIVGQPLVVPVVLANRLLQALVAESPLTDWSNQ